jgi:putative transposase
MPRQPRLFLPDLSVHVVQRGNNRMAIFGENADYEVFLTLLKRAAERYLVAVHAYVLMTNHFHLIATPRTAASLPRAMQQLGVHYVRFYNDKYQRIGTLWNSRYKAIHIQDERYWLTCLRYVEQNPVRAGMVSAAADYRWSSHAAHAFGDWPVWLSPHFAYQALGSTNKARECAYRAICGTPLTEEQLVLSRQPVSATRGVGGVSGTPPTPN